MSDTPSQSETAREAAREASEPSSWAARQATRLSGDGPLPGAEALSQVRRGILCVKCERLNELDAEKCAKCSSHLHVFCHRCGAKNPRVQSRCEKCKKRLHRSVRDRVRGNDANPVNLVYVGLGLVGIVLAIIVLLLVSGFRLPRLW